MSKEIHVQGKRYARKKMCEEKYVQGEICARKKMCKEKDVQQKGSQARESQARELSEALPAPHGPPQRPTDPLSAPRTPSAPHDVWFVMLTAMQW